MKANKDAPQVKARINGSWEDVHFHSKRYDGSVKVVLPSGTPHVVPSDKVRGLDDVEQKAEAQSSSQASYPWYCVKTEKGYVGLDRDKNRVTKYYDQKNKLMSDYGSNATKGVGKLNGNKVFQLIIPPNW